MFPAIESHDSAITVGADASTPRSLTPIQEVSTDLDSLPHTELKADSSGLDPSHHVDVTDHESRSHDTPVMTDISFHIDSDTIIKAGQTTLKVSIFNVAAASPVWSRMLYGSSSESRAAKDQTAVIEVNDDTTALKTLMNIIHYKFNEVPVQPTLDELWNITQLTSKYQCTHLIYPWASKWLEPFATFVADEECPAYNHKAAWIAWELGDGKLLKDMTDSIVVNAKVDKDGDLVNVTGQKLKDMVLPPNLLDRIKTIRSDTISEILTKIKRPLDQLSTPKEQRDHSLKYCRTGVNSEECEAMMLGCTIPPLVMAGLYPIPKVDDCGKSIRELNDLIKNIKLTAWEGRDYMPHKSHRACSLHFTQSVDASLKAMPIALEDMHMSHLETQAAVSGVGGGHADQMVHSNLSPTAEPFKPKHSAQAKSDGSAGPASHTTAMGHRSKQSSSDKSEKGSGKCSVNASEKQNNAQGAITSSERKAGKSGSAGVKKESCHESECGPQGGA